MTRCLLIALLLFVSINLSADPLLHSWFTERSGSYARLYQSDADQAALNAVTTWNRGDGVQDDPTYAGIHEVRTTDDWLYIRSTNLASYIMGPWYGDLARTNLFPSYPANQAVIYRFPRNPTNPTTVTLKTLTGGGPIGYMVNGVSMFDSRDAFSYSSASSGDVQGNNGDLAWNRDAYINEGLTFDAGNAHQASANHHYHANPPALRHQLGDSVDFTGITNTYTENFNGTHSPIIGWVRDGLPVYGPYGYSDPLDPDSAVRRMISGYQLRTDNTRASWPAWPNRIYANEGRSFVAGPPINSGFPIGRYMEDNDYKGDLDMTLHVDFDLNEYNVRWCVTPDFPAGTWAYFTCIAADGTPVYPYNIAPAYFGNPTGSAVSAVPENDDLTATLVTHFEGGPEKIEQVESIRIDNPESDQITLTWSAIEGGSYQISETSNLANDFTPLDPEMLADSDTMSATHAPGGTRPDKGFYQITRSAIAYFDDTGFDYEDRVVRPIDEPVTLNIRFDSAPNDSKQVTALTFGGQAVDLATANLTRPVRREIEFDILLYGRAPSDYTVEATYSDGSSRTQTYTIHPNILLMIVDDWGTDRSPLDNLDPDAELPNMPNLQKLADSGLHFSRAYAQPACSPTRASILTGRQVFQHKVGSPEEAGQFSGGSGIDEITLPEIFTSQSAPQQMISVGKWHLGGNDSGYASRGGWPEFYGINSGGVQSYYEWTKNSNGTSATSTTYSTTDQVNEASEFIRDKTANAQAWFAWVAFNGVHSPFEAPPAELAPAGGYSPQLPGEDDNAYTYRKLCEALDTEIGRLLESVDLAQTNIILIGDNGTPGQVVQAPFGSGRAKGSIYNGGTNVPLVVAGPAVTVAPGTSTDKLVHCVDLFSTILAIAGIDEAVVPGLAAMNVQSNSILPILNGSDSADRVMVAETGGPDGASHARAIITDDFPDYKLVIYGDPDDPNDSPSFEFYHLANDWNEQSPLGVDAGMTYSIDPNQLSGDALSAYTACVAVDTALGGGYSDLPESPSQ